jgi:hypothetical protein
MLECLSIPAANGREPTHRPPPKVRMATKCLIGSKDILLSAKSARTRSVLGKRVNALHDAHSWTSHSQWRSGCLADLKLSIRDGASRSTRDPDRPLKTTVQWGHRHPAAPGAWLRWRQPPPVEFPGCCSGLSLCNSSWYSRFSTAPFRPTLQSADH